MSPINKHWKQVPVEEYTSPSPLTVAPTTPIQEISQMMRDNGIRHLPVVKKGVAVGIISDRDVKLASSFMSSKNLTADDIMSADPYTVLPETNLDEVAFEMSKNKYGSAIVQDESGQIMGVFTSTDALNALIEILRGDI